MRIVIKIYKKGIDRDSIFLYTRHGNERHSHEMKGCVSIIYGARKGAM